MTTVLRAELPSIEKYLMSSEHNYPDIEWNIIQYQLRGAHLCKFLDNTAES